MRRTEGAMLAERLGVSLARLGAYLTDLRKRGVARSGAIWFPARAGRTIETLTYVKIDGSAPGAVCRFEAVCRQDPLVTTAVAVTGVFDYALWSFHEDHRAARTWLWTLEQRGEVRRVESKTLCVLFGHLLAGALVIDVPAPSPVRSGRPSAGVSAKPSSISPPSAA